MSLEDLRKDLARNAQQSSMASLPVDVRTWARETLWPFFEAVFDLLEEHEGTLDELTEQAEDFLHADTAQEIGKPITIGFTLADELEKRAAGDQGLLDLIAEYRSSAAVAVATLRDVSIADDEDEDEGEGDPDDPDAQDEDGEVQQ